MFKNKPKTLLVSVLILFSMIVSMAAVPVDSASNGIEFSVESAEDATSVNLTGLEAPRLCHALFGVDASACEYVSSRYEFQGSSDGRWYRGVGWGDLRDFTTAAYQDGAKHTGLVFDGAFPAGDYSQSFKMQVADNVVVVDVPATEGYWTQKEVCDEVPDYEYSCPTVHVEYQHKDYWVWTGLFQGYWVYYTNVYDVQYDKPTGNDSKCHMPTAHDLMNDYGMSHSEMIDFRSHKPDWLAQIATPTGTTHPENCRMENDEWIPGTPAVTHNEPGPFRDYPGATETELFTVTACVIPPPPTCEVGVMIGTPVWNGEIWGGIWNCVVPIDPPDCGEYIAFSANQSETVHDLPDIMLDYNVEATVSGKMISATAKNGWKITKIRITGFAGNPVHIEDFPAGVTSVTNLPMVYNIDHFRITLVKSCYTFCDETLPPVEEILIGWHDDGVPHSYSGWVEQPDGSFKRTYLQPQSKSFNMVTYDAVDPTHICLVVPGSDTRDFEMIEPDDPCSEGNIISQGKVYDDAAEGNIIWSPWNDPMTGTSTQYGVLQTTTAWTETFVDARNDSTVCRVDDGVDEGGKEVMRQKCSPRLTGRFVITYLQNGSSHFFQKCRLLVPDFIDNLKDAKLWVWSQTYIGDMCSLSCETQDWRGTVKSIEQEVSTCDGSIRARYQDETYLMCDGDDTDICTMLEEIRNGTEGP